MAKLLDEIMRGLEQITVADLEAMAPAERQRPAQQLKHWASIADRGEPPKGVLGSLGNGDHDGDG